MISVTKLTASIGAEVSGVDLSKSLTNAQADRLKNLLAEHQVLFLRDQNLNLGQQKALTTAFGPIMRLPYVQPMDGDPEVIRVYKGARERGGVFGGDWHTDFSFLERPPAGSVLSASILPPFGGDTLWISQAAAWEALPEHLKELLLGRGAIHVGKPYGLKWAPPKEEQAGAGMVMARGDPSADEERLHPAVLQHPLTGRRMLFLNPTYVTRFEAMSEEESRPFLSEIQAHSTRPEFSCRFRWSSGTIAIWDNLATQHYAVNDYHGYERLMYRTTFSGPAPGELAAAG